MTKSSLNPIETGSFKKVVCTIYQTAIGKKKNDLYFELRQFVTTSHLFMLSHLCFTSCRGQFNRMTCAPFAAKSLICLIDNFFRVSVVIRFVCGAGIA